MKHQKNPKSQQVESAVSTLPCQGVIEQDSENGMLFLNLDDNWIYNALEKGGLKECGYIRPPFFVYPPYPIGAHIKIITKREAEDHDLFGRDLSHLIGKTVDFEVVSAHVSYPRIKKYGIEARYKIRIESSELSEIRKELTGLSRGPNNGHFVILVGLRMNEEEFEQKFSPDEKHEELDDTTPLASTKKSKPASSSSDDEEETEETIISETRMKLAAASQSKPKSSKKSSSMTKKSVEIKPASTFETSSSDEETSETRMKLAPASKSMTKKSKPASSISTSETSSSDDESEASFLSS